MQVRLTRLHRPGPWRVALAATLALASATTALGVVVTALSAPGPVALAATALVGGTVLAGVVWLTGRVLLAGVYVADAGVALRGVGVTRRYRWCDVVDVRRVPARCRLLGLAPRVRAERVVLVLRDGTDVATPVTGVSPDFLGRAEAFDIAALALDRWWAETRTAGPGPT